VLLKTTFAAGLGAGVLGGLGMVASFVFPSASSHPSRVLLGNLAAFPVGSKKLFGIYQNSATGNYDATQMDLYHVNRSRSAVSFREFWLVNLAADREGPGLLALSARCHYHGCFIAWREELLLPEPWSGKDRQGWFHCPCRHSYFTDSGSCFYGGLEPSMDRFKVIVEQGDVSIDIATRYPGSVDNAKFAVDPTSVA
jgi:Rieske Fe-S protein